MPTIQEFIPEIDNEPVIFSQPVAPPVETFDPVTSSISASDQDAEQPIIFELSVDSPVTPEAAAPLQKLQGLVNLGIFAGTVSRNLTEFLRRMVTRSSTSSGVSAAFVS